jgi:predicted Rossmann-fold nucleotide-binding protein
MEEMLEMITWSQLNIHSKPIILLNTKNFFDLYIQWIQLAAKGNLRWITVRLINNFCRTIHSRKECEYICYL